MIFHFQLSILKSGLFFFNRDIVYINRTAGATPLNIVFALGDFHTTDYRLAPLAIRRINGQFFLSGPTAVNSQAELSRAVALAAHTYSDTICTF